MFRTEGLISPMLGVLPALLADSSQQQLSSDTVLMWRSTSPQVMPTPRVSLHPRPSPPRGKRMASSPNSDRLPSSELSGAWLRPCLRLHYSPTSPSTPVLLPSFLSLPRADPMPIVDISSSQSVLALGANISGTPLKSKSTFFLLKMPFKSLRMPCDIFQWLAMFIKPPVLQGCVYECFMVRSCETALFQWIPLLPSSPGTNKTFLARVGSKQTPREQFPPIF